MIIKINGTAITKVKKDFPITERKDEEFDSSVLIFYNSSEEPIDMFSIVEYLITNDTTVDYTFLVDSDAVDLVNKDTPAYYRHTLSLIEPTKLLERIIVENLAFTQPKDPSLTLYTLADVLNRVRNIVPLETSDKHAATRLFNFDTAMMTKLAGIRAPEMFPSKQNLFTLFNEVFKYEEAGISRIATFESGLPIVKKEHFNTKGDYIDITNYVNKNKTQNIDYLTRTIDVDIANGITDVVEKYPPYPNLAILTTESLVSSTNDLSLILPKRIYKVKKLTMVLRYKILSTAKNFQYVEHDITDYLYEQEYYDLLPVDTSGQPSKYGSLVYKKGDNKIMNFGVAFPQFFGLFTTTTMQKILNDYQSITVTLGGIVRTFGRTIGGSSTLGESLLNGELGFRVEYYPYIDQRQILYKQLPGTNKYLTMPMAQSSRTLDMRRLMNNAQGTIDRLGNGDLVIEKVVRDFTQRYKVGQWTDDNYLVTSTELTIDDDSFRTKAVLNKNFNRLSQFVQIDRDYRQYNLSLQNVITRNLSYNEFILFETTSSGYDLVTSGSFAQGNKGSWLRDMFRSVNVSAIRSIEAVLLRTYYEEVAAAIGTFYKSIAKSYSKNTFSLHFEFHDNTVAYFYPRKPTSTNVFDTLLTTMYPKRYVYFDDAGSINNGKFKYMSVQFIAANPINTSLAVQIGSPFTITEALAHYNPIKTSYPKGIFYRLTTPTADTNYGGSYEYVLLWYDGSNIIVTGVADTDIVNDLLYNMGSTNDANGDPDGTTDHRWYNPSLQYPFIKYQQADTAPSMYNANAYVGTLNKLVVHKDPSEKISMTYSVHHLPGTQDVIIGETMVARSPYFIRRSELAVNDYTLYYYFSTETYTDGDTMVKGTKGSESNASAITRSGFEVGCSINVGTVPEGTNSWAIGDNNGNLYVAVNRLNGVLKTTLFVALKNKV